MINVPITGKVLMEPRHFILTGGAGFIGSHTTELLLEGGHSVTVLDNFSTGKRSNLVLSERLRIIEGSILSPEDCDQAIRGADHVIHLAAQISVGRSLEEPAETYQVNVDGTRNVLESSVKNGVLSVVFLSSSAVYGNTETLPILENHPRNPLSPYAESKLQGEALMNSYRETRGLNTAFLRLFNIYGPRQDPHSPYASVMSKFMNRLILGAAPTIYGDGNQTRDFVFVKDVARILTLLGPQISCFSECGYNVATEQSTSVLELWSKLSAHRQTSIEPDFESAKPGDIKHSLGSAQQILSRLRELDQLFSFTPLTEGLAHTFEWYSRTQDA